MNASTSLTTYDWISKDRFWLGCSVATVFVAVGWGFLRMGHIGWGLVGGVLFILGVLMFIQKKITFDKGRRVFLEAHRFLGFLQVWQRTLPFDRFDAVVIEKKESAHPSWPRQESQNYDISYRIGLRRKVGRPFWIRHDSFSYGQPYLRVEEFARRLSCDTGFEIIEVEV